MMGENRNPNEYFLSPNEASSNETELYLMEFLANKVPWEPPNNMAVGKIIICSPQTDRNTALLKTPTQVIEHEVKLVPT